MEPYFIWNDTDSRNMGLIVQKYPPVARPLFRSQSVTIPGRAGALTILEADVSSSYDTRHLDTYDQYTREIKVMPDEGADIPAIMSWLSGSGVVLFGHEPDKYQLATVYAAYNFAREYKTRQSATITFLCDPFKYLYDPRKVGLIDQPEEDIHTADLTQSYMDINGVGKADVRCWPLIVVQGTGDITISCYNSTLVVTGLSSGATAYIDTEAKYTYLRTYTQLTENSPLIPHDEPAVTYGDYFFLQPDLNRITYSGTITSLVVHPRWRWF